MRLNLDDNERGAFNYLFGGVVVVLVLKGVAFLADMLGPALSPDQLALRPFQQGYPMLRGELATVGTSTGLTERLVLAVVVSVGITFLLAFVLAATARAMGRGNGRAGRYVTRVVMLLSLCWTVLSAFLLPVQEARVQAGKLILSERHAAIGDIPWPFTLRTVELPGPEVLRLEAGSRPPDQGCNGAAWIDMITAKGHQHIGAVADVCAEDEMKLLREGSDAAAVMERELR